MSCARIQSDVLGNGEVLERHPAGEDHVHDHQGLVVRRVDEDVVRGVVRPVVVKEQPFPARLQDVMVVEGDGRRRPVRVCLTQQQAAALAVADAHHIGAQQGGRSDVVGVGVRVHQVGDLRGPAVRLGHGADGAQQVVPDCRWRVDENHAVPRGQEHGLVDRVGHPVQVAVDVPGEVAVSVERRPECARWYRRVVREVSCRRRPGVSGQRATDQGRGGRHRSGCSGGREEAAAARGVRLAP